MKNGEKSESRNRIKHVAKQKDTLQQHYRQSHDKMLIDLGEYLLKVEGVFSRYHHN